MDETFLDPTILNGLNSTYIADLYEKWLEDPKSIIKMKIIYILLFPEL